MSDFRFPIDGRALRASLVPLAILAASAGCGRSCGCIEGEKSYEKLDGKVKVELVRNVHWSGGRVPGPMTTFVVRVHTDPAFDEPVSCDHVDMAEDDAGKLVAFRCNGDEEWTVLRLRGGDARLRECDAPVGKGRKPDFKALASLSSSATRIADCNETIHGERVVWPTLVRAIFEDEGAGPALATLATLAARGWKYSTAVEPSDPWRDALRVLPAAEQAKARADLCSGLASAKTPGPAFVRAAMLCPLDAPGVGDAAVTRFGELLVEPPAADASTPREWREHSALAWSAVLAITQKAGDAAKAACVALGAPRQLDEVQRSLAALAIAKAGARCAATSALLTPPPCSASLDCDGGLCTAAEIKAELGEWPPRESLELGDAGARPAQPTHPSEMHLVLAAAYAQGPLPPEIVVRNARRLYTQTDGGPSCDDSTVDAGQPCTCTSYDGKSYQVCDVDAATVRAELGACAVRFDDKARQITDVRRACRSEGEACTGYAVCCGELRCLGDGRGASFCAPPPPPPEAGARRR